MKCNEIGERNFNNTFSETVQVIVKEYSYQSPKNRFRQFCSLAGRYDNPIPTRLLAHIDCSKVPALHSLAAKPI
jgi:hypothetical protein